MTDWKTDWKAIARGSSTDALAQMLGSSYLPMEAIWHAGAELTRRSQAPPPDQCPNLTKWRAELAAGVRDAYKFDDLWRKACDEMNQLEWNAVMKRRPPSPDSPPYADGLPF